jgi:hypothetical protein
VSKGGQQQKAAFPCNGRPQNKKKEKRQPLPETYKNLLSGDGFSRFLVRLSIAVATRNDDI